MSLSHQQVAELKHIARTTDQDNKVAECQDSRFAQLEMENQLLAEAILTLGHRATGIREHIERPVA